MHWLKKEAHGKKICLLMIGCLILDFAYTFFVFGIIYIFKIDLPAEEGKIPIVTFSFLIFLVGAAFIEEMIFRFPLAILIKKGWSIARVLVSALALSAIFGVLHGGIHHIFFQGIGGLFYSILFLKCGGLQKHYFKAIMVTTITHFSFNAIVLGIANLIGR